MGRKKRYLQNMWSGFSPLWTVKDFGIIFKQSDETCFMGHDSQVERRPCVTKQNMTGFIQFNIHSVFSQRKKVKSLHWIIKPTVTLHRLGRSIFCSLLVGEPNREFKRHPLEAEHEWRRTWRKWDFLLKERLCAGPSVTPFRMSHTESRDVRSTIEHFASHRQNTKLSHSEDGLSHTN